MSIDICEYCGHPQVSHHDEGNCEFCEADKQFDPKAEICQQFRPDVFNMWDDDDDEDEET